MPRKPLGHRRKPEILQAFARCIGRWGVAGTSLDAVAQEAEMRRSILRHFVGNREQLVEETAAMVAREAESQLEQTLATLPVWSDSRRVAEAIVSASHLEEPWAVFDVLVQEAGAMPRVAALVARQFDRLTGVLADWLQGWSGQRAEAEATTLLALRRQVVCRMRLGEQNSSVEVRAAVRSLFRLKPVALDVSPRDQPDTAETEIGVND